ncbi:MAG: T9SS type A sorting domain-containing protein, partial [Bacteroidota bacterium]
KQGIYIPYAVGDYTFYYDNNGDTHFYRCIQAHADSFPPPGFPAYWDELSWNGRGMPPMDIRTLPGSFYAQRGLGLSYDAATPFPVEWLNFEANPVRNRVELKWTTGLEENNDFFTIERATDGQLFEEIGNVDAKGAGTYRFADFNPEIGTNQYRIRQTDLNGNFSYSDSREVNFTGNGSSIRFNVYPNPWRHTLQIDVETQDQQRVHLSLFSMNGQLIRSIATRQRQVRWDEVADLPVGLYMLEVRQGDRFTSRIVEKVY